MRVTVMTHRRGEETAAALRELVRCARAHGATLRFDRDETARHGLRPDDVVEVDAPVARDVDLCVVLGGDGTILTALRAYAGVDVPVFAVNFGEVGFLATIDPESIEGAFARALRRDFETLDVPGICALGHTAFNDISVHRKPGLRVADLAYRVCEDEIGRVRCDGLVVATPQGSTGYNLANGGPVLAWGVHGYVVSFIAPHSLTARALVVAPGDSLIVANRSKDEPVEMHVDGRPAEEIPSGGELALEFGVRSGKLAQLPGASFYHRLAERFGRLV